MPIRQARRKEEKKKRKEGLRRTDDIFNFCKQKEASLALERRKYHNLFDPARFEKKPKDLDRM